MTAMTDQAALDAPVVPRSKGKIIVDWITSTDHKTIGYMYLIGSFFSVDNPNATSSCGCGTSFSI